jgi:glycosyltransferase involved in cell wall biosynthesis
LREEKGHINLLEAFSKVCETKEDCYLYLIGHGFKDNFQETILHTIAAKGLGEKVVWLDAQDYPGPILKKCDLAVLASEWEGFPLAVVEYGLCKLPLVCTAVGEIPSILTNNEHALLVPPKDADALAEAILSVIDNLELRQNLSINLNRLINEQYSAEAITAFVMEKYHSLLVKK